MGYLIKFGPILIESWYVFMNCIEKGYKQLHVLEKIFAALKFSH